MYCWWTWFRQLGHGGPTDDIASQMTRQGSTVELRSSPQRESQLDTAEWT